MVKPYKIIIIHFLKGAKGSDTSNVFRSLINLFKKIGKKYYPPRGKSIAQLILKIRLGEIKKINISGCILEKINDSFIIYKEKWKKGDYATILPLLYLE